MIPARGTLNTKHPIFWAGCSPALEGVETLMRPISDAYLRLRPEHIAVESRTPDGKTRLSCADSNCAAWAPRPCESRREAQFWYDRHISQPLIYHL